jgi:hypothetical protein
MLRHWQAQPPDKCYTNAAFFLHHILGCLPRMSHSSYHSHHPQLQTRSTVQRTTDGQPYTDSNTNIPVPSVDTRARSI